MEYTISLLLLHLPSAGFNRALYSTVCTVVLRQSRQFPPRIEQHVLILLQPLNSLEIIFRISFNLYNSLPFISPQHTYIFTYCTICAVLHHVAECLNKAPWLLKMNSCIQTNQQRQLHKLLEHTKHRAGVHVELADPDMQSCA